MTFLVAILLICFHSGCHSEGKPPITSPKTRSVGESHDDAGWAEFNKISTQKLSSQAANPKHFSLKWVLNEPFVEWKLCARLFSNEKRLKIIVIRKV